MEPDIECSLCGATLTRTSLCTNWEVHPIFKNREAEYYVERCNTCLYGEVKV